MKLPSSFLLPFLILGITTTAFIPAPSSFRYKTTPSSAALFLANVVRTEQLEKPLGLILSEVEENKACGVYVEDFGEAGSATLLENKDKLIGLKIVSVNAKNVENETFEAVMDCIIEAESPVTLDFADLSSDDVVDEQIDDGYEIGTPVIIKILDNNTEKEVNAKVGDNLRKVLLDNKIELYKGLKKKLGNCGGGGQCTFCAVDFVEQEGWGERSDYENQKIAKYPQSVRLACMNNIQGHATIRIE